MLGSIGAPELILILLILVVLFGARKLPELGKSIGESIRNFKKSVNEAKDDETKKPNPPAQ